MDKSSEVEISSINKRPLLGVMINTAFRGEQAKCFGKITGFLEECAAQANKEGLNFIVFHPDTIDLARRRIVGWRKNDDMWALRGSPLPDIIYNRILSRKVESVSETQEVMAALRKHYQIPIFNGRFLDKLEVHQKLEHHPGVEAMLPETYAFSAESLEYMLARYRRLYIKPVYGSLGIGIMHIEPLDDGWILRHVTASEPMEYVLKTRAELHKVMSRKVGTKKYLIQQGLTLANLEGQALDFRVLVQRDRKGEWQVTSCVGRVTNNDEIVSNLARGATIMRAKDALEGLSLPIKPSLHNLQKISLEIMQAFDYTIEGHFAECGIDLAIDIWGKVWIIELNSKPSKNDGTIINNANSLVRPSVRKLMEYVVGLGERINGKREH